MTKGGARPPRTAASISALARALGVHRNSASRWVARGCPRRLDGSFDVAAVERWHASYVAQAMDRSDPGEPRGSDLGRTGPGAVSRREADTAYRRVRAALAAIELRERREALFPAADVPELLRARRALWHELLLRMAKRAAPRIAAVGEAIEVEMVLRDEIDHVLRSVTGAAHPTEPSGGTSPSET